MTVAWEAKRRACFPLTRQQDCEGWTDRCPQRAFINPSKAEEPANGSSCLQLIYLRLWEGLRVVLQLDEWVTCRPTCCKSPQTSRWRALQMHPPPHHSGSSVRIQEGNPRPWWRSCAGCHFKTSSVEKDEHSVSVHLWLTHCHQMLTSFPLFPRIKSRSGIKQGPQRLNSLCFHLLKLLLII